jgi:hypothetical protein
MNPLKHGDKSPSEPEKQSSSDQSSSALVDFHALSNALEIILQSSYLISTTCTDENSKKWIAMLNDGVDRAIASQRALRKSLAESGKLPVVPPEGT